MLNKLFSTKRNEAIFDEPLDSLYVFLSDKTQTNIDILNINDLQNNTKLSINSKINNIPYITIDDSFIYFMSNNSELIITDKSTGEVSDTIPIKSICSANIVYDSDFIYLLCVLPTRVKGMNFTTYFVQKINKIDHKIIKFSFFTGIITKQLFLKNNKLYFSDTNTIRCMDTNGNILWTNKLQDKMDNTLIINDEYIVSSSRKGVLQGFSLESGKNEFNIKLLESEIAPVFNSSGNILYWFNKENYCSIDIQKLKERANDWQNCEQTILPDISCGFFEKDYNIIGSTSGQIESGKDFIETEKTPIISIKKLKNNIFLIDNKTTSYVFEKTND